jgi:hypothetical protein
MDRFTLEKTIWNGRDFEVMSWHDATLWSMYADTAAFEFLIDLDYIFSWVEPKAGETHFKFWVAPVTIVFENASDVKVNLESQQGSIEVAELHRELIGPSPSGKFTQYAYRFECQEGEVSLEATGFKMFVRQAPRLISTQSLEVGHRNGISFGKITSDA